MEKKEIEINPALAHPIFHMPKINIKNLSKIELAGLLKKTGEEPYRARQIFRWLYAYAAESFDEMSDIPHDLRKTLKERFHIARLGISDSKHSSSDMTSKYLLKLEDGNAIETVLIPEGERLTVCLSSQVGCRYACGFCASAPFGFIRNLNPSEITGQVTALKDKKAREAVTNLVFMGIGEPLDNYDNVIKAARIFNDKDAFNIGSRRITLSTCGIIPGIKKLESEGMQIELSVSLHSADDGIRSKLVPVNKKYPIKELIKTCKDYIKKTGRIITFEYVLIKGVNSSREDAAGLARVLKGIKCKVNTISYNRAGGLPPVNRKAPRDYEAPSDGVVRIFIRALKTLGINAVHRKSKGGDIDAGCGQLRVSKLAPSPGGAFL